LLNIAIKVASADALPPSLPAPNAMNSFLMFEKKPTVRAPAKNPNSN
jgi:hypothetical protein